MDALARLEDLYACILDITEAQFSSLERGDLEGLQESIARKQGLVVATEPLFEELRLANPQDPSFRDGLRRLGLVLEQIVVLEEKCTSLAPSSKPKVPPRHAVQAYGKK